MASTTAETVNAPPMEASASARAPNLLKSSATAVIWASDTEDPRSPLASCMDAFVSTSDYTQDRIPLILSSDEVIIANAADVP